MNDKDNTIVVSYIPYVDGIVDAKYYDAVGSVFLMTTDENYRYFKGNGLPSTPMGKFPVQKGSKAYPYYEAAPGGMIPIRACLDPIIAVRRPLESVLIILI